MFLSDRVKDLQNKSVVDFFFTPLGDDVQVHLQYIDLVSLEVEKKITSALPSNFGLIVNGWSQQSENFVGVFACFDVDGVNEKPLLAFSVLPDETDLGADSIAGFIETTMEYYKKTRTDVKFIVSDNEPTM